MSIIFKKLCIYSEGLQASSLPYIQDQDIQLPLGIQCKVKFKIKFNSLARFLENHASIGYLNQVHLEGRKNQAPISLFTWINTH